MSLIISGATIINGVTDAAIEGQSIWIVGRRIEAIGRLGELNAPAATKIVDACGKYVIPGLMNANVHLLCDSRLENLARYWGRYEQLITEAAQIALKNGLTTVFDTHGPRRFLISVRDKIDAGRLVGSRIFCAGNIVGFDGPFSDDFHAKAAEVASAAFARRINAIWVENVGRYLMWLPPQQVARQVREYINKGIDFIKYASNEHFGTSAGAFLAFSPQVQAAIVEAAHRAGLTAQAHTTSVEGLRIAVEAGCDLVQHANHTGPVPIPESTLELLADKRTGAVVFPFTERALQWLMANESKKAPIMLQTADDNVRRLVSAGARILLANDGAIFSPEISTDPVFAKSWAGLPEEDGLLPLATGHFAWFKAMEEKGCRPLEMLKAATSNIAMAYGKEKDLGTLEPGKLADMLILDKNPLLSAENYRCIHMVVKDGSIVDRDALPVTRILTRTVDPPTEEEASYVPFLGGGVKLPMCPGCFYKTTG